MDVTLVVLAAGQASRYGRLKQLEPVGPHGASLLTYSIFDAAQAGFTRVALVVPPGLELMFEKHVRQHCRNLVSVTAFTQELNAVPSRFTPPENRVKPWGTAHAVLAAAAALRDAFVVVNADDFYGPRAYQLLHEQLAGHPDMAALVGYELSTTLSSFGGVSRGLCEEDEDDMLVGLTELHDLTRSGDGVVGIDSTGRPRYLHGHETVSMNLWGLNSTVVDTLRAQFSDFCTHNGGDPDAEFLLSTALDEQVRSQRVRFRVLKTDEQWFGMTFPQDTASVRARVAQLVARGQYPHDLSKGPR